VPLTAADTIAAILTDLDRDNRGLTFRGEHTETFVSYRQLGQEVGDLAARWSSLGHRQGDRVVLIVADEREFVLAFLSALRAGVVPVPMFPPFLIGQLDAYLSGLRHVCEVSGAARCLVSAGLRPLFQDAPPPCPVSVFEELRSARPGPTGRPAPGDPAFLQFTSGSTGDPKGIVVTHRSLLANVSAIGGHGMAVDAARDRGVSWLPLYHDMGLIGFLFVPLCWQASVWYLPPLQFARNPLTWLRTLSEVQGTIAFAPNFAYGLLTRRSGAEAPAGLDLSSWRIAGCGAEPVRPDTLRRFADLFAGAGFRADAFMPSYGLAEATLAVTLTPAGAGLRTFAVNTERLRADGVAVAADPADQHPTELVSSGQVLPGTEVRILGPDGMACAEDREGEIVVAGDSLAAGYFGDPERTERTWRDGWLHTGDCGFLHRGELFVTGRIKDLIIVNGRNHQPQDIEAVAASVPGVRPGNVLALPSQGADGEGVRIVLEAREGAAGDLAAQVRRKVRASIGLAVSDVVVLPRDGLPKTSSGKLRRSHTAQLLATGELTAVGSR
jgi:fatty-acyl-CoA synthase